MSGARDVHAVGGFAGCVMLTRARTTGTIVGVYAAEQQGLDPAGGCAWYTVCHEHGGCCGHRTRALARSWAARPDVWCGECADTVVEVSS